VNWAEERDHNVEANQAIVSEHERVDAEIQAYINRLEQSLVEEMSMIKDLKSNLHLNFFIIDELYQEEFQQLGVPYENYMALHPKGDYSKEQWVEEKEKELYKIKSKNFQKTKKQALKDARKHQHGNVY
jgi:predicted RND superfamily exporter protein